MKGTRSVRRVRLLADMFVIFWPERIRKACARRVCTALVS